MNYLLAFLGISLVIFVHELGHFLAARLCGVRVETFSIGMGPRLLSWKRGHTRYQVAVLPLGGYVKMSGEELADLTAEPREPRPYELGGKSVGARFLIFSGGVIMNVLFGLVVFPLVFLVGVPFEAPVIGSTAPGSSAWQAGIQPGTTVLEVDGEPVRSFNDITTAIALGPAGAIEMRVQEPGATEPRSIFIEPDYNNEYGLRLLGVYQAYDEALTLRVAEDSAAARAGIQTGDHLRGVEGAPPGYDLVRALVYAQSTLLTPRLQVETPGEPNSLRWATLERPAPGPDTAPTIGVTPLFRVVKAVRGEGERLGLQPGDRILSIDDQRVRAEGDLARLLDAAGPAGVMAVERGDVLLTLALADVPNLEVGQLAWDIAVGGDDQGTMVRVVPDSPAYRAGMRTEDRIMRVGGTAVAEWSEVASSIRALASSGSGRAIQFEVFRQPAPGAKLQQVELAVTPAPSPFDTSLGLQLYPREVLVQADSIPEAFVAGAASTWHFLEESWLFVRRIVSQDISASNAGGIITIGAVSSHWANEGLSKLFFFLALLSMNLAFLNILPIPLLDGGHLFFLLIEKLKGSPVSPRIQIASQGVGMVLLLSLMLYVTVNDVMRWLIP